MSIPPTGRVHVTAPNDQGLSSRRATSHGDSFSVQPSPLPTSGDSAEQVIHAVLNTYELLESIIAFSDPAGIAGLKGVARAWFQLIQKSKRIKRARCQVPFDDDRYVWRGQREHIPLYHPSTLFSIHPALRVENGKYPYSKYTTCRLGTLRYNYNFYIHLHYHSQNSEYATNPPCKAMGLELTDYGNRECTVYVPTGIRVRDLVDAGTALLRTYTTYIHEDGATDVDLSHVVARLDVFTNRKGASRSGVLGNLV